MFHSLRRLFQWNLRHKLSQLTHRNVTCSFPYAFLFLFYFVFLLCFIIFLNYIYCLFFGFLLYLFVGLFSLVPSLSFSSFFDFLAYFSVICLFFVCMVFLHPIPYFIFSSSLFHILSSRESRSYCLNLELCHILYSVNSTCSQH